MEKVLLIVIAGFLFVQFKQPKPADRSSVTIYTTAKGTGMLLKQDGQLSFKEFKQPLETQPTIFH